MTLETATPIEAPESSLHFRSALISTAGHCAVACGFCFRADRAHGFLDVTTYARTLSRLREIGVGGVCLTGGEPTHHPQLRTLVRLAHQFGMSVSMVTSARTQEEVSRLSEIGHLLETVTVSADSHGAMLLGRTKRSAESAAATLRSVPASGKVLHLTYWKLSGDECGDIHRLVEHVDVEVQLSPVTLDPAGRRRSGISLHEYVAQQREDAEVLRRYFVLSQDFQDHLTGLRTMQLYPERRRGCHSSALYVSANGEVRRCPYGKAGISVHAPRAAIKAFLGSRAEDRVTPDCAAICRPSR
ncbi:radical SAM protein [Streptomyces sp. AV19]|uniref:radical SAM protein n=1 Tax=Streptomyces sp. AV19 TaxID=2793068 RepID=UPI0018FEBD6B|nr:radical SAM protein [Streptomyces sp. AV19]MBH1932766.1 radical SAM protein [Streptomyces sp. AV19]MDG4531437.1 radical SAM protein [Streptomyces sp. AV19]